MGSSRTRSGLAAVLAIMLMMVAAGARAGESRLVVTERIGRAWEDELVTFTREFAAGECREDSLRLAGTEGPVPVQVLSRERWEGEGGFLKRATFGCYVSVAPFTTVVAGHPGDGCRLRAAGHLGDVGLRLLAGVRHHPQAGDHHRPQAGDPGLLPASARLRAAASEVHVVSSFESFRSSAGCP